MLSIFFYAVGDMASSFSFLEIPDKLAINDHEKAQFIKPILLCRGEMDLELGFLFCLTSS